MRYIFPAWEKRFNGIRRLVKLARKLEQGHGGQVLKTVRPYCDLTCVDMDKEKDTYTSDEPTYSLELWINTRDSTAKRAGLIVKEFEEWFDDADIKSAAFETVNCQHKGGQGPFIEDGVYRAMMRFEHQVSLRTKVPNVRFAN